MCTARSLFYFSCACLQWCAVCQVRGVTDAGLRPRPIRRVAVLGGGLMGSGIATALVLSGLEVVLKEVNQQFLEVCLSLGVWTGLMHSSSLGDVLHVYGPVTWCWLVCGCAKKFAVGGSRVRTLVGALLIQKMQCVM